MKREREVTAVAASSGPTDTRAELAGASNPTPFSSVSPPRPRPVLVPPRAATPASNGAPNANGAAMPKGNGDGSGTNAGNSAGNGAAANKKPRVMAEAGGGIPRVKTTATMPTGSTSNTSSNPPVPSLSLSSGTKRPKFGIVEPPEGWRKVAEEILRVALAKEEEGEEQHGGGGQKQGNGRVKTGDKGVTSRRKFAAVCSANFNRSMMAHKFLQEHHFHVESYGTGRDVRLPGKDVATPEVFPFGTPYLNIYNSLQRKDEDFFRRNNLLGLVARNASIKMAPQRFQEVPGPEVARFDVVLCFESRVFYMVVEDLQSRDPETFKPLHVVNMTIKDSPEESAAAADDVLHLCRTLDALPELDGAAAMLDDFAKKTKRTVLHQVCHV